MWPRSRQTISSTPFLIKKISSAMMGKRSKLSFKIDEIIGKKQKVHNAREVMIFTSKKQNKKSSY
jgi:hypothetical protein